MIPALLVWGSAAAFAGTFGTLAILRHRAFGSGRFDLGNMTQAVWSTAHGDVLSVTDVHGAQISRLGSHFDPILAALAPLWWIWPDPELLLAVQAIAVAAGALPVFWLARKHLGAPPAAALAVAYLLYPPVQWLTVSDFHPVALACPLLLFAWWHLDERRLWAFAFLAAAALATKEHVGLAIASMGIWYAVRHRGPRAGAAIAVAGAVAALVAVLVVVFSLLAGATGWVLSARDTVAAGAGSADVGFLADMRTHHQQALEMALLELANGENPVVLGFAREVVIVQGRQIGWFEANLQDRGVDPMQRPDEAMGWMGMAVPWREMPGMASEEQMQALREASGAEADTLFLELMAAHHAGGIDMAGYAAENAEAADVRAMAARIEGLQRTEIAEYIDVARREGLPADIPPPPPAD